MTQPTKSGLPEAEAAASKAESDNEKLRKQIQLLQEELAKKRDKKKGDDDDESDSDAGGSRAQLKSLEKALSKFKKRRADAASAASSSSDKETGAAVDAQKVELSGNWLECLDALDLREAELLEEVNKAKSATKKAKEERLSWKKKAAEAQAKAEKEAEAGEEAKNEAEDWKKKC